MPRVTTEPESTVSLGAKMSRALSFRSISAVYILIALFAIYALWVPDTFLNGTTLKALLDNEAITAIVAVALVIPLSAGGFNLAIGAQVGFGSILSAWLLSNQELSISVAIILSVIAGGVTGLVIGLLIVRVKIDSFIASLGASSVLLALIAWISNSQQILDLGADYQSFGTGQILGLTHPVWLMVILGIIVWYVLERTPAGRRLYATGGNVEAARLAGVRTGHITVLAFVACGAIAAFAGTLVSSRLATGDPTVGPSFLLPAFAAAFLGSTQFRGGRYNVWGTVLAVYVLAVGVKGLQLAGAPVWIPDLFDGVALLIAVAMARYELSSGRSAAVRRVLRLHRSERTPNAGPEETV